MKFHEFGTTDGRTIRVNQEQISEIEARPNNVTTIWMASGSAYEVNLVMYKVLEKLGANLDP
jgi:uncharacterized protein YlzI (FlbEa/FlbD family)